MRVLLRDPRGQALQLARESIALGLAPPLRAAQAEGGARQRLNPFPGRTLTASALTQEQRHRAWHLAQLLRARAPGVLQGLGVQLLAAGSPDPLSERRLLLEPGQALSLQGEELLLTEPLAFDLAEVPLVAPAWWLEGGAPPSGSELELLPRRVGASLRQGQIEGRPLGAAGLLLLQPVEFDRLAGGASPCERDLEAEAFDDEQRQEAARLLFYLWPEEWLPLPPRGPGWRNRLAHALFAQEALLGQAPALPWWRFGVPLALVGLEADGKLEFVDSAAALRRGAVPRALPARGGTPVLWQARVEQLREELSEAAAQGTPAAQALAALRWLPPCGLLPRELVDWASRRSSLPASLQIEAAPVPIEELDALLEAAAPLAPIDLALGARLRLLVPVPQSQFEPGLLEIERADADGRLAAGLAALLERRADALRRRQLMREREQALAVALEGPQVRPLPALLDDPQRLEDESSTPWRAAPLGDLHLSAKLAGMHQHYLWQAATPLLPGPQDRLFCWVMLDAEAPPRQLMLQWWIDGRWEQRAFWGEDLIAWGQAGTPSRLRIGALPEAGQWLRLELPAAAVGLAGARVEGVAFTLFDGRAVWGPMGLVGQERQPWVDPGLVAAAQRGGDGEDWQWLATADHAAPFEPMVGTQVLKRGRASQALETLLADAALAGLQLGARGARQSLAERVRSLGLNAAVSGLRQALARSNDHIDFGFVRVQADLYRLRQGVLTQTQASRLAVSPALNQIAELDNASATRAQLGAFFEAAKGSAASAVDRPRDATLRVSSAALTATVPRSGALDFNAPLQRDAALASRALLQGETAHVAGIGPVLEADALTGLAELRTTSIAARMAQPRAVESKNFTLATRIEVTRSLRESELDLDAVQVSGVPDGTLDAATGQPKRGSLPWAELGEDFARRLTDPTPNAADEAHYFLGGVDVADHTIGLLRQVEGVAARYRAALARCEAVGAEIASQRGQAQQRLREIGARLAEARHDVASARSLLDEELARAQTINTRRSAVLAGSVRFLAFVRPLAQRAGRPLPARALSHADALPTVPACLAEHGVPPPAVQAMVAQIRRAPLAWFRGTQPLRLGLDRHELLDTLAQHWQPQLDEALPTHETLQPLLAGVQRGLQQQRLAFGKPDAALGLAAQREHWLQGVGVDDLLSVAALRPAAAAWGERLARVAGCLHARLSQVSAAQRLSWVQAYSEHDAGVELGDLSRLPGLATQPEALRTQIQELAAWIRAQADPDQALAQALLNTLLRVCLLSAGHAPSGALISGSLLQPRPLLPLAVLPVRPDLGLAGLRLGQGFELMEGEQLLARGVVHDLRGELAELRVETLGRGAEGRTPQAGARVRFLP